MAVLTLAQESLNQGAFYVPQFELRLGGSGLSSEVLRDIQQVTYRDNIKQIDGFEFTVNNWDPATRSFKYVGSETTSSLKAQTDEGKRQHLFDPGGPDVTLRMGYVGHLVDIMTGVFTTLEPNFPSSGGPTLTVRALNVLHKLRTKQFTYAWTDKKDSEIAESLATLTDKETGKKRFPLPVDTDSSAKQNESSIPYVAQENMYDIEFLLSRARVRGYVVVRETAKKGGKGTEQRLFFGPSLESGLRDVTFELAWGKSLIEFKPTLTTANQVKSVTVHGWNRSTKKAIAGVATIDDQRVKNNKDLHDFLKKGEPREEVVVNEPVFTEAQAKERALAILSDRQKEMVTATGSTVGLPDLRAGRKVLLSGLGARFSGSYFLTETTHTIGASGYTTRFTARREDSAPGKGL